MRLPRSIGLVLLCALVPAALLAEAPEEAAHERARWESEVGASLVSLTGNANTLTTRLTGRFRGELRGWASEVRAAGVYGQARTEAGRQVTARGGEVVLRGEREIAAHTAVYVQTGLLADHVASIEYQVHGEPGLARTWIEILDGEKVRTRLRTDLGFRMTRESRFQYFPEAERRNLDDQTIYAPRLAASFRQALGAHAAFTQQVELLPDVLDRRNLRANATSTLSAQIVDGVALQVAFLVRYIGVPAEGRVPTDTELSAGVAVTF
jgi:hypothetical protein